MCDFNGDVSDSESVDNTSASDVSEVETNTEASESEPDEELSEDLDDKYDSYIEEKDLSAFEKKDSSVDDTKTPALDLEKNADNKYDKDVKLDDGQLDNSEKSTEEIKCRNAELEGKEHPETGVPFERQQVEVDGKTYDVVVPVFESSYDAKLPEDMYTATDRGQFKECNAQLKNEIATNEELRGKFDEEQLEQIENGEVPDGFTWHHDAEAGKMQLVDTEMHQKTGHTGGRNIWGGGTSNR